MAGTPGDYGTVNSAAYREQRVLFQKHPRMATVQRTPELVRKWRGYRNSPIGLWEAVAAFQRGDVGAADGLVYAMYPAIVSAIKKYGRKAWVNYPDCVQEGIEGLFEAAARFDLTTDKMPFTYLYDYLRGSIQRYLSNAGEAVRIPTYIADHHRARAGMQCTMVFSEMTFDWDRDPSQGFEELILDNADPADEALDADLIERTVPVLASWFLSTLPETNAVMMREYHGGKTLQEIGDVFGLSRERVRQIIELSLGKCRRLAEGQLHVDADEYPMFSGWLVDACESFLHISFAPPETRTMEEVVAGREAIKREREQQKKDELLRAKLARTNRKRRAARRMAAQQRLGERFPPISDEEADAGVRYKLSGPRIARRQ